MTAAPARAGTVSDFPFVRPDPLAQSPELARRRAECPVSQVRLPSGDELTLLTDYDDVVVLLSSPAASLAAAARPGAPAFVPMTALCQGLLSLDAPEHVSARRMLSRTLSPGLLERQKSVIDDVAARLVADLFRSGSGADFVSGVAEPLAVLSMAMLLGIDADVVDDLRRRFAALIAISGTEAADPVPAWEYLRNAVAGVIAEHDRSADDGLGALLRYQRELSVPDAHLVGTIVTMVGAGIGTPIIELAHGVAVLLRHREQWADLCRHRELVPAAVEEILRYCTPVEVDHVRVLVEDIALPSGTLAEGTGVLTSIAAANRDDERFPHGNDFDIRRPAAGHLAFGRGPHACAGSVTARHQLRAVLRELTVEPSLALYDEQAPLSLRSATSHALTLTELRLTW